MWAIAEQIYSQLVTHSVVTLIIGKLNKRDHLLDRSKSFHALFITVGLNDGLADLFETSWIKINTLSIASKIYYYNKCSIYKYQLLINI